MPKNPQVWLLNSRLGLNPNKAGLCEGSFLWGGVNLTPPSYFKKN